MLIIANNMTNNALSRIPVNDFSYIHYIKSIGIIYISQRLITLLLYISHNTIILRYGLKQ